jgi:hypothetical protein
MNILGSLLTGFSWRSDTVGGYDGDHCLMGGRSTRPHCDRPSSACGKKVVVKQRLVLPSYFESQWPKRDLWGYEEERLFIMHSHSGQSWIDFGTTWSHYAVDCNCFFSPPSLPLACYLTRLYNQLVCSRVVLAYVFLLMPIEVCIGVLQVNIEEIRCGNAASNVVLTLQFFQIWFAEIESRYRTSMVNWPLLLNWAVLMLLHVLDVTSNIFSLES